MDYNEFLKRVIDEGIEAAKKDYVKPEQKDKLEGSILGFEKCRGKNPEELVEMLKEAGKATNAASGNSNYWYVRCQEAEIEWVCNCVSAIIVNGGQKPIIPVTARGALKAAEIVGVKES